jgi:hypothetical protein
VIVAQPPHLRMAEGLPDFVIRGPEPLLLEIKPAITEDEYRASVGKMTAGLTGHWHRDILILGGDPLPQLG